MAKSLKKTLKNFIPENLWSQLRDSKQTSVESYYRLLARQLLTCEDEEHSGLTYLFEAQEFNPELVIRGYMQGIFPSSVDGDGQITWHDPDQRGFLPIHDFHIPRNLRRILRQEQFEVRVNDSFSAVMEGCGENRKRTQINSAHIDLYMKLHEMGIAHSVSAWQDDKLVGGTYGIAIGGYFASESAFHRVRDASKVATVRLTEILAAGGFVHHDTWWFAPDIEQFGGGCLPRAEFHTKHIQAVLVSANFDPNTPRTISIGQTASNN